MRDKGLLITCDRCGKQKYIKHIGEFQTDKGYTIWEKYENQDDGWTWKPGAGDLCKDCAEMFEDMMKKFMEGEAV